MKSNVTELSQAFTTFHTPIIVHCHLRWDFVWQRPQQLLSRLATQHPVLFVEEPIHEAVSAPILRLTQAQPGIVRAVPVLPESHARDTDAQCATIIPLLDEALVRHPLTAGRWDGAIQWFYSPMTAPQFLGRFGTIGAVYDCMDELSCFRFAPEDIGARERFLMRHARVVFTGGPQLQAAKARLHDNVHCFGCGVDAAHYALARAATTRVPDDLTRLPHPILGYFGVVDERIDYPLLAELAGAFPDASIVMVGPFAKVDPATLPKASNLHWLGQRDYAQLPALVKGFDVCLMPFARNDATRYINPTKTLEYMAAGKPIVSTAIADVISQFAPIVKVAGDHAAFIDAVASSLRAPRLDMLQAGIERANRAGWESIVAAMRGHLADAFADIAPARRLSAGAASNGAIAIAAR